MSFVLKVLIVTPTCTRRGGGVTSVVKAHAQMLAEQPDVQVQVLALQEGPLEGDERAEWDGIDFSAFNVIGTQRFGYSPEYQRALMAADADLVHVHGIWQFHCYPVLRRHRAQGTPYIVSPHGMMEPWIRSRSRLLKNAVSTLYQNAFLREAAAFHALTDIEVAQVHSMATAARVDVIPNFVDEPPPADVPPPWWDPAFEGRDVYLFLGRLHEKKGCRELCAAWEQACNSEAFRQRSALVFCGPVDGLEGFAAEVAAMDARFGNIRFAGPQYGADKNRSIRKATFFCLPSKSEGLPVTVLDAWAAGVPTIMTPECNLDIGFTKGAALRTGFTTEEILASLQSASAMPAVERAAMAASARRLVADHYSRAQVADSLLALYRSVTGEAPARVSDAA
jgi:glycosyltransferase involved in cell wall biosynthesis